MPATSKVCLLLLLYGGWLPTILAQKAPMKFGKIDAADLQRTECTFDPGAGAMILGDYAEGEFYLDINKYYAFKLVHHRRIKIFSKNSLEEADVTIPYYAGKTGDVEFVLNVRALCYYLENGKIRTVELAAKDVFTHEVSADHREVRFAIPGVREGCVLEYIYELRIHDIHNLRPWAFQTHLPVEYSECRLTIPSSFVFQTVLRGNRTLDVNEEKIVYQNVSTGNAGDYKDDISLQCRRTQWAMRNLPAFKAEPFMGPEKDFAAQVEFQLLRIDYGQGQVTEIADSYEKFNAKLLQSEYFGQPAKPDQFCRELAGRLSATLADPREKARAILAHLQEHIRWNLISGIYSAQSHEKLYTGGSGSVADINLLAVACLRAAGLSADPVLIGTRNHARPNPKFLNEDRFNFVAIAIDLDGKTWLADAGPHRLPPGFLPINCLNGAAWRVSAEAPGWIELQAEASGQLSTQVTLQLEGDSWTGKCVQKATDYKAVDILTNRVTADAENYVREVSSQLADWGAGEVVRTDELEPLSVRVEIPLKKSFDGMDMMYIKPVLAGATQTNPFTAENRQFPVNFPFRDNYNYVLQMTVPEGYQVLESPKSATIVFGAGQVVKFQYTCSIAFNTITIVSKLQMNKLLFGPEEYAELKRTFDLIVQKNQEMVVLKKG